MTRDYGDGDVVEVNEFGTGEERVRQINDALARGDAALCHYLEYGRWPTRDPVQEWAARLRAKKHQRRLLNK